MDTKQHLLRGGVWGLVYGAFAFFIILLLNNLQVIFAVPLLLLSKAGLKSAGTLYQQSIQNPTGLLSLLGASIAIYGIIGGLVYGALRAKDYSHSHSVRWAIGILVLIAIIFLIISFKIPLS